MRASDKRMPLAKKGSGVVVGEGKKTSSSQQAVARKTGATGTDAIRLGRSGGADQGAKGAVASPKLPPTSEAAAQQPPQVPSPVPPPTLPPMRAGPPAGLGQMMMEWSDRYNLKTGFCPLDVSKFFSYPEQVASTSSGSLSIEQLVLQYQWGNLDEGSLAHAMINALFERDFWARKDTKSRWSRDGSRVDEVTEEDPDAKKPQRQPETDNSEGHMQPPPTLRWRKFRCECSATWDWKDIYSVASSKAIIAFRQDRTRIQLIEYGYNCSG